MRMLMIIGGVSVAAFLISSFASARLPAPIPQDAVQGKKVWQSYNCISCHTLFGNGGYVADDMTHIVMKRGQDELKEFLINPPVMRPNRERLHPGVSSAEAEQLISYLKYVDTIPTLGWPPPAYTVKGGR